MMAVPVPENLTRYQYFYMAKLAHQAQRYDDTVKFMDKLVFSSTSACGDLTSEEQNILFCAYKNLIDSLRAAWQTISTSPLVNKGQKNKHNAVVFYKSQIESELSKTCASILSLLDSKLIPSAASASETKVLYLKMKGDYNRYLAEFKTGEERERAVQETMIAYKDAEKISRSYTSPMHPIRLGLALNLSVFCYEVLGDSGKALSVARDAFEQAAKLNPFGCKESGRIMQLLKENYNLWTSNTEVISSYYD